MPDPFESPPAAPTGASSLHVDPSQPPVGTNTIDTSTPAATPDPNWSNPGMTAAVLGLGFMGMIGAMLPPIDRMRDVRLAFRFIGELAMLLSAGWTPIPNEDNVAIFRAPKRYRDADPYYRFEDALMIEWANDGVYYFDRLGFTSPVQVSAARDVLRAAQAWRRVMTRVDPKSDAGASGEDMAAEHIALHAAIEAYDAAMNAQSTPPDAASETP